jgi:hypothetical protein
MMLMKPTTVVGLMTLAVFACVTEAQRFRGGTHGEELRTARRMEITPPSDALADVDAHAIEYYDDAEDHDDELALLRGQRALTEKSKSKSKKSKSKSKKSKSKTEKSMKSKSDKGTKSTKKSKSDKGTKSTKKSKSEKKSDKGTKSTKKSKSKSKSNKSKSMKSMTGTQRAAVLDRLQILNGGGVSTSLSNTNPQLAGRSGGLGLINMLENNDEMEVVFGQKLPRANTNDGAEAETTLSKLAQLAAAAF